MVTIASWVIPLREWITFVYWGMICLGLCFLKEEEFGWWDLQYCF